MLKQMLNAISNHPRVVVWGKRSSLIVTAPAPTIPATSPPPLLKLQDKECPGFFLRRLWWPAVHSAHWPTRNLGDKTPGGLARGDRGWEDRETWWWGGGGARGKGGLFFMLDIPPCHHMAHTCVTRSLMVHRSDYFFPPGTKFIVTHTHTHKHTHTQIFLRN